jgi:hypothetical protein
MADAEEKIVTVDNEKYRLNDLPESTKAKMLNIQFVDTEIVRVRNQLVVLQAARKEFSRQLKEELPRPMDAPAAS